MTRHYTKTTNEQETAHRLFCFKGLIATTKLPKLPLTPTQTKIYNLAQVGWTPARIAKRLGTNRSTINDAMYKIKYRGWTI